MAQRKLKRQLNLGQVIMLGAAGTIAAEIFVLTGHAAGIAGPETVLALIIGGFLTLSIALNYCELATFFPFSGGAMTYIGEAFGKGWLHFVVGSLDCLSSAFYAALSSVGFAYSLSVLVPGVAKNHLTITLVALTVITVMGILHIRGVSKAGNLQLILGMFLLTVLITYIVKGLTSEFGFSQEVFNSGRAVLENQSTAAHLARMLTTIALIYNAYVGFEVIADDAEEIVNPSKNIPIGILASLALTAVIYSSVAYVTIGTVPYNELAGSETALTQAAAKFWPSIGVQVLSFAGIIATLTSMNAAMLSATREAFTLSRDQAWPRMFSRLSRWRTPYVAVLFVMVVCGLVASIGLVDFLSFISSAGYMFVLFWATLALPKLRKMHPDAKRPFKVPLYPLTVILALLGGLIIIIFADKKALAFLGAILVVLTMAYYLSVHLKKRRKALAALEQQEGGGRILIGAKRDGAPESLVELAAQMIGEQLDTGVCLFRVVKTPLTLPVAEIEAQIAKEKEEQLKTMAQVGSLALQKNFPIYTKLVPATRVEEGFMRELQTHHDVKLLLLGFPRDPEKARLPHNVLKEILVTAQRDVAIVRDKGLPSRVKQVLVALGTGPNAVLGLQLVRDMLDHEDEEIVAMRVVRDTLDEEHREDELAKMHLLVDEMMGQSPAKVDIKLVESEHGVDVFLDELTQGNYDLFVLGAGGGAYKSDELFGSFADTLMEESPVSVMVVRRYQREGAYWLGQQLKKIEE